MSVSVCRECVERMDQALLSAPGNRTRDIRVTLMPRKFHLDMRKLFFAVCVTKRWNRLPRECGVFLTGDIQKLSEHNPVPFALG